LKKKELKKNKKTKTLPSKEALSANLTSSSGIENFDYWPQGKAKKERVLGGGETLPRETRNQPPTYIERQKNGDILEEIKQSRQMSAGPGGKRLPGGTSRGKEVDFHFCITGKVQRFPSIKQRCRKRSQARLGGEKAMQNDVQKGGGLVHKRKGNRVSPRWLSAIIRHRSS